MTWATITAAAVVQEVIEAFQSGTPINADNLQVGIEEILTAALPWESDVGAFDLANVGEVVADVRRHTHFTAQLWRLMLHSDGSNLFLLQLAFPKHAAAMLAWQRGPNTDHNLSEEEIAQRGGE